MHSISSRISDVKTALSRRSEVSTARFDLSRYDCGAGAAFGRHAFRLQLAASAGWFRAPGAHLSRRENARTRFLRVQAAARLARERLLTRTYDWEAKLNNAGRARRSRDCLTLISPPAVSRAS
jgi:hypothetical protein